MSRAQNANPEFARRLKELRKNKGFKTRPSFSKFINEKTGKIVSVKMIGYYETGYNNIPVDISEILAAALDCDPQYFTDENFKYPTRNDEFVAIMKKCDDANYYMNSAVISLLKLNGYEVKFHDLLFGNVSIYETSIRTFIERFLVVSKDGKEVFSLSIMDLNKFGNNLVKNFNVLLSYYLDDKKDKV